MRLFPKLSILFFVLGGSQNVGYVEDFIVQAVSVSSAWLLLAVNFWQCS